MGWWSRLFSTKEIESKLDLAAAYSRSLDAMRQMHQAEIERLQEYHRKEIESILAVQARFTELLKPVAPSVPQFLPKPEVDPVTVNAQGQVGINVPKKNPLVKPTFELAIEEAQAQYFDKKAAEERLRRLAEGMSRK